MTRSRPFSFTSVISKTGSLCLPLFQLVFSDPLCEENEMFLLLIFLVALLCGAVLFCLQCWLRRCQLASSRRTMAVFAVGDLDSVYGAEAAVNPTAGIHLQTQIPTLHPAACFNTLGPPPPYEEILKSSQF
ncbi:transmembrane protein 207 isoform X2 [Phyllostomus hastatus]|uniref:transmembrane protein 207 isoform X2 n=1 Tax=Phyllostomus hastatus TaxID=9423 RepID=UPI001E6804CD|nr:transmembrane protein 207 isoform X2 [Phyllostomus hastatus]